LELLEHPPYNPDLAPREFHLFGGKYFADNEEVETEAQKWLRQQVKDFCPKSLNALVNLWNKCINVGGGYVEK
jgi:hypothetical protein